MKSEYVAVGNVLVDGKLTLHGQALPVDESLGDELVGRGVAVKVESAGKAGAKESKEKQQ